MFSRIVLHYDKVQSMVREVELYEKTVTILRLH